MRRAAVDIGTGPPWLLIVISNSSCARSTPYSQRSSRAAVPV
jgi:hypothetical protein